MQRILHLPLILLAFSSLFISCSEESNPQFEADNFTRVYDNNQFNMLYSPLDVEQTPDGGFLILASMRTDTSGAWFPGVYLLKTDKYGKFVKELEVDPAYTDYLSAAPDLMPVGDQYYFVCMNNSTQARLVAVSPDGDITATTDIGGLTYPLATSLDGQSIVTLAYDHANKKTLLASVDATGAASGISQYDVGAGGENVIDALIIGSFLVDGRKFPYFVGRIPNSTYYFNGFQQYTLSLIFTSKSGDVGDVLSGSVTGQQENGGMSALLPLGGGKFAGSRFMFKENYLLPNLALEPSGSGKAASDLVGLNFPEMVSNSVVKVLRATINNKDVVVYGVNTKSGQIGLLFYDAATGAFLSSRYLGFSNPYEIGSLLQTKDGGLAVSGTTYIAGRFARICLFKFSKDELAGNVTQ